MSLLSPSEQQMGLGKAQSAPSSASGSQVDLISESPPFPLYKQEICYSPLCKVFWNPMTVQVNIAHINLVVNWMFEL